MQTQHSTAAAILAQAAPAFPHLAAQVDRLGEIKAAQATLQAEFDRIRAEVEDAGLTEVEGTYYRATFSTSTRSCTDWQAIARKLKASPQLIRAHTTTSEPSTACRVTARKTH